MDLKNNIAISDTGFIFDPNSGDSFSVNPIGKQILDMLKENNDFEEIKSFILETYNVDLDTFEKDFYDFMQMLQKSQLLTTDNE